MPIRGSPNGAGYLRPQAGRDRPESVVAINRNALSQSIGMAGRDRPVRAAQSRGAIDAHMTMRCLRRRLKPMPRAASINAQRNIRRANVLTKFISDCRSSLRYR